MSPLYTYAVARPFDPARLAGLRGVDGAAVTVVRAGDLLAITSSLASGTPEPDDLPALEALARAHDRVVAAVSQLTTVLPFRLGTVHLGRSGVVGVLRDRHAAFGAALDRVAGCVELGVKAYAVARPAPVGAPGSGREYLAQRRERQEAERRAVAVAGRVGADLLHLARDGHAHSAQASTNLLNASYLVDTASVDGFVARVAALDRALPELDLVVTGPWAPYSFAAIDEDMELSA